MKFESKPTDKGNVGVSYESQEAANQQAAQMDAYGCTDCRGCTDCINCTDCTDCINCTRCADCIYCTDCTDCIYCTDCINCTDCTDCINCTRCAGVLGWRGHKASSLLAINGLAWPVTISESHIQIGCQYHAIEEWAGFPDSVIHKMHSKALLFWREHKGMIMTIAKHKEEAK